ALYVAGGRGGWALAVRSVRLRRVGIPLGGARAIVGSGVVDQRSRELVAAPFGRQPCLDGVVEDVLDSLSEVFIGSQEVVVEARLPEAAPDTQPPRCSLGEVLELTDEGHEVTGRGWTDEQMDVVRHDAVGVDGHAGPRGEIAQHGDRDGRNCWVGEDLTAPFHRDRDRADPARLSVDLVVETEALPWWVAHAIHGDRTSLHGVSQAGPGARRRADL